MAQSWLIAKRGRWSRRRRLVDHRSASI